MTDSDTDATTDSDSAEPPARTRTRSRRRARAGERGSGDGSDGTTSSARRRRRRRSRGGGGDSTAGDGGSGDGGAGDDDGGSKGSTRLAARRRERSGRPSQSSGRRSASGVALSDEARRAAMESPPRTMVVTSTGERTQIAVLEERSVVEHYVARKGDVSYVGNIYMGRVQNVLPGMEAAFVDIGKGRNGILYAGEVLYDEQDVEDDDRRIEQALTAGQKVLVQVTKDPMGTKGPRLTQHLSLAGRYMVLAPDQNMLGISRKLSDDERDRLRRVLRRIRPSDDGVIVRTAAAEVDEEHIVADLERLQARWERVKERAKEADALTPVYEEPGLVVRVIRDIFGPEFERVIVDTADLRDEIRGYLEEVDPEHRDLVELYEPGPAEDGEEPLSCFAAYHVDEQLRKAIDRKQWLPSGGYLIIEKTEAMTVIDVNTGKFTGSSNLEETVLKTNLEAARETVRQLRLRDIGGIIVVDFIDMLLEANQDEVIRELKRELLRDRTKTRVSGVSRLGLVQMTRKNVSQGLIEAFSERCEACGGHGYITKLDV